MSTNININEQLAQLLASQQAQTEVITAKARRSLPKIPAQISRAAFIAWMVGTSIVSFGAGGVKVAIEYYDEIHATEQATQETLPGK